MEHLIWIAFWIVAISGCLQAKAIPILIDDFKIKSMNKTICPDDSRFYTPMSINVTRQCFAAALECFKTELNGTVKAECENGSRAITQAVKALDRFVKGNSFGTALTNSSECPCESWPTTTFKDFLKEMETLLQRINSENSS